MLYLKLSSKRPSEWTKDYIEAIDEFTDKYERGINFAKYSLTLRFMIMAKVTHLTRSKTKFAFRKFHLLKEIVRDATASGIVSFLDTTVLESLHRVEKTLYNFTNRQNTLNVMNMRVCNNNML